MTCQLYLITPPRLEAGFDDMLAEALQAGEVAALQLRLKDHSVEEIKRLAPPLIKLAQSMGVAVILNDDPELAVALGCDGVHVGQGDVPAKAAREAIGPNRMLGVTCHDSRHLAMQAGEAGADYVAFGAFYPTATKDAPTTADPEILEWWSDLFELPCVAIGGITVDNAKPLIEAGADFLAVSSGVWSHVDGPAAAVIAFNALMRGE
ncbi:thiamine phosphate synthase [Hyphobacterium sp. CCMP332]|uniref:thiamine phosphate synthase n=1 Tax=Hyphobacterium sp. CCMP332 TaxID=2749086 RepID=UPI00164EFC25|nr:thiamine phosphate synthase [Hyphobacterium sp. CCMP332]QNL19574.1 thiamine phosphate synthase [Hyphobacterium sp. CCMP332]